MSTSLESIVKSGTKLWLDSIEPELIDSSIAYGATGATSNPIIIANILKNSKYHAKMKKLNEEGLSSEQIAWRLTDQLVSDAEAKFLDVYKATQKNDGYVSFELDPLIEDSENGLTKQQKVDRYVELGLKWAKGHKNRLIKIPATEEGILALEPLTEKGVNVNVTLIFTISQLEAAREAVWKGAQKRNDLSEFKSVYSIFVSRVDVYASSHLKELSEKAKGLVGIYNAKKAYDNNKNFWKDKNTSLDQEMVFASTGVKNPEDKPWKYVEAFCGSDIQTNPPETNLDVAKSGITFSSHIEEKLPTDITKEIESKIDWQKLENTLMTEGLKKFSDPQKKLLEFIETEIS